MSNPMTPDARIEEAIQAVTHVMYGPPTLFVGSIGAILRSLVSDTERRVREEAAERAEAAKLATPEGETVMADGGPATESETEYVEYLKRIGRREGREAMLREVAAEVMLLTATTGKATRADLLAALEKLEGGRT